MKNKLKENYHRKSIRQYYHDNVAQFSVTAAQKPHKLQDEVFNSLNCDNSLQTKTEEPLLTEKPSSGGFKQSETMDNHKARGAVDNTRDEINSKMLIVSNHPEVNSPILCTMDTRDGFSCEVRTLEHPESHYQHWLKTALGRAYLEARR